jgi:hypothetical protein
MRVAQARSPLLRRSTPARTQFRLLKPQNN